MAIWDRNSFHGTIPNGWLSSNRSLYTLSVYENLLTGPLPTEWYEGKNISNLDFYLNLLEGEIPLQFYQLKGLSHLAVGRNAFSGSISRQIGNLSELAVFEAAHNCLTGTIPSSLGQLRIFFDLDIGHNYLTGTIPREIRGDIDNKLEAVNDSNEVGISPVDSFDETNRLPYLESDNQQIVDLPDSDRSMEDIDKTKSSDPADVKLESGGNMPVAQSVSSRSSAGGKVKS
eukprot:gene2697-2947_t